MILKCIANCTKFNVVNVDYCMFYVSLILLESCSDCVGCGTG